MSDNLYLINQNKTFLNAKILAWCDLLFGLIPLFLLLLFAFSLSISGDGIGGLAAISILIFWGLPVIIHLIFHIFSFKYLKKNNHKGIIISLIPKFIILISALFYLIFIGGGYFSGLSLLNLFIITITILTIILIMFNFIVKKTISKKHTER